LSSLAPLRREETLAVGLSALAVIGCVVDGVPALQAAPVVLLPLALLWRTRHPLGVLVAIMGAALAYLAVATKTPVVLPPLFVALYTVAAHGTRRRTLLVALVALPFFVVIALLLLSELEMVPGLVAQLSQFGFALALGEAVRTQRALIGALRERAERAERDRALESRRRVNEERVRIARDVHDVVAHSIATISTQASVGIHVGRDEPERAVDVLQSIKSVSAQALRELRHVLGALRDGPGGEPTDPTPSLRDVPRLVQQARDSGMSVVLKEHGRLDGLPAMLEVAVYRIVQEALTNVMRHASGAAATVLLSIGEDQIEVVVRDDGRGSPRAASEAAGAGSGIDGMRERAGALGGVLEAGPVARNGFCVRAVLPLEREAV